MKAPCSKLKPGRGCRGSAFTLIELLVQVVTVPPDPVSLNLSSSGSSVTLTWSNPAFTLLAAPEVSGAYTNVPGATSPPSPTPATPANFIG